MSINVNVIHETVHQNNKMRQNVALCKSKIPKYFRTTFLLSKYKLVLKNFTKTKQVLWQNRHLVYSWPRCIMGNRTRPYPKHLQFYKFCIFFYYFIYVSFLNAHTFFDGLHASEVSSIPPPPRIYIVHTHAFQMAPLCHRTRNPKMHLKEGCVT